jgi:phosphonate transport system substrate-binding protein
MKLLNSKLMMKLVVFLFLFLSNIPLLQADDIFRIGIFPRRSVEVSKKMFTPLSAYLEQQLNKKIVLDVPPDMPAFWSRLEEGKYDLVHLNQYHYVRAHAKLGWQAILKNEELGEDTISAALWVLNSSDIRQVSDLRKKLIVFGGGDHAMVASIMTRDMLLQAGINDDDYIGMTTIHPMKSIISVYYKQADAAGVSASVVKLPAIRKEIDTDQLRLLVKSEPVAHLPWAIRGDIDDEIRNRIVNALLSLNGSRSGVTVLKSAGLTGIRTANDSDYDKHREIIKRVLNEQY